MARALTLGRRRDHDHEGRGGAVADGARRGAWGLARLVMLVAWIVVGVIVAGILLVVLEANPTNAVVEAVTDAARWLAGPFKDLFTFDNAKTAVAVNWGLAAVVYLVVASVIARLLRR
ncbi:MAG TPA: hypothetical protein VNB64_12055 [Solirubrobacteraceae bacterium]|nr:hypothetical protein [Solirubrobacteraceae bacterium]